MAPRGRNRNITGISGDISRTGTGLGTGPVGNPVGYWGRPGTKGLLISSIVSGLVSAVSSLLLLLFRPKV